MKTKFIVQIVTKPFILRIALCLMGAALYRFKPKHKLYLSNTDIRQSTFIDLFKLVKPMMRGNDIPLSRFVPPPSDENKTKVANHSIEELSINFQNEKNLLVVGSLFYNKKDKLLFARTSKGTFILGRDGSRAFVSGDFTETGLIDNISGLTSQDYIGLDEWVKFYYSDYKYVGKLVGSYYNEKGEETEYYDEVQKWIAEAYAQKEEENDEKKIFPPCNSEWSAANGARVWCTIRSGGIEREWKGVPRKLIKAGQPKPRCACVKPYGPPSHDPTRTNHNNRGDLENPNLQEYPGCQPDQPTCVVPDD
ncbi:unnamed protein product, partial [Meganyctiphanes norvegica]